MKYQAIEQILTANNQHHLLAFYDQLDADQQQDLLSHIELLDFAEINTWVENHVRNDSPCPVPAHFAPADYYPASPKPADEQKYKDAYQLGVDLLSAGKVAAFVVAGGQGTRLGFNGPKGNYPVSPIKNKTLFQIFAETILAASKKYAATIPWYIMTSPLNHTATVETLKSNDFFGLSESDVFIFQQGTNVNFSMDGQILLADKGTLATSPDGHGGSLRALAKSGAVADMQKRGIEQLSYFQVDNPIVHVIDPLFIGLHASTDSEMSSRALIKAHPMEKVGNFCLVDGKVNVIEYSDLPDEDANKRCEDGSLAFELGSIAIHMISVAFIKELNAGAFSLPIHRAVKKISHIDPAGNLIKPTEPNGIKLETFVFDALPLASNSIILETIREEEFAPVKNAEGDDSPAVTKQMMTDRAANWLEAAGVSVPGKADGTPDCTLEIAPSFAFAADQIAEKLDQIPKINPGDTLYLN